MRTARLALVALVPLLWFSACIIAIGDGVNSGWGSPGRHGSGVSATQTRLVGEFHALRIEGSCDAKVTVGGERSVQVTADDNLIDDLTTEVQSGVLVISTRPGVHAWFRVGPKAVISVPSLTAASIEGSGEVEVTGLSGESFMASIDGSGDLRASGHTKKLEASIEGSGDMDLSGLESEEAKVSIDGSGDIRVRCSLALTASVSGSGDINYLGSPPKTNISVSGSGDVHPVH